MSNNQDESADRNYFPLVERSSFKSSATSNEEQRVDVEQNIHGIKKTTRIEITSSPSPRVEAEAHMPIRPLGRSYLPV